MAAVQGGGGEWPWGTGGLSGGMSVSGTGLCRAVQLCHGSQLLNGTIAFGLEEYASGCWEDTPKRQQEEGDARQGVNRGAADDVP